MHAFDVLKTFYSVILSSDTSYCLIIYGIIYLKYRELSLEFEACKDANFPTHNIKLS